jgi:hypothetical protein
MFLRSPQIIGIVAAILTALLHAANAADGSLQVRIDASKPSAPEAFHGFGRSGLGVALVWGEEPGDRQTIAVISTMIYEFPVDRSPR